MFYRTVFVLFVVTALLLPGGCSRVSREPAAQKRAERFNAAKTEARTYVDSGLYDKAIAVLEQLSREVSGDPQVFVLMGISYRELGRNADAVSSYEKAIRLAYTDFVAHLKLANLLMDTGKTGRALTEFELAAKYGGDFDAVNRYNYGLALYQMGKKSRALEEWRAAHDLERGDSRYAEAVGIGLTEIDPASAVGFFEEAAALGADNAGFFNNYALALFRTGETLAAAEQSKKAVELEPDNEGYRFNLAAAYTRAGAFRDAIPQWDFLIARFGPRWSYTVYKGEALLELGEYDAAIGLLAPVVEARNSGELQKSPELLDRTPPNPGDALETLAMCYRSKKDLEQALKLIESALALDPDNPSFLNNYGVISIFNNIGFRNQNR